jgi:hypothetical protein
LAYSVNRPGDHSCHQVDARTMRAGLDAIYFLRQCAAVLKPGGSLLLAEPAGHVKPARFDRELASARAAGLELREKPRIRRSLTALFVKPAA